MFGNTSTTSSTTVNVGPFYVIQLTETGTERGGMHCVQWLTVGSKLACGLKSVNPITLYSLSKGNYKLLAQSCVSRKIKSLLELTSERDKLYLQSPCAVHCAIISRAFIGEVKKSVK